MKRHEIDPWRDLPSADPCTEINCSFNAECVVDETSQVPTCKCRSCEREELANNGEQEICGSDGETYKNKCELSYAICKKQKHIYIKKEGACDQIINPCNQLRCEFGGVCIESITNIQPLKIKRGECICPDRCEDYFIDASNDLRKNNFQIIAAHVMDERLKSQEKSSIIRQLPPAMDGPICGSDGKDYINLCELRKIACREKRQIDVLYWGKCDPCEGEVCQEPGVCTLDENRKPVCNCNLACVDGLKDDHERNETAAAAAEGHCQGCTDLVCKYYAKCEFVAEIGHSDCVCPQVCIRDDMPVCGSDGVTVKGEEVSYSGDGDGDESDDLLYSRTTNAMSGDRNAVKQCSTIKCNHGAVCRYDNENNAFCHCDFDCESSEKRLNENTTEERVAEEVCGTDGRLYPSECALKAESCRKQTNIQIQSKRNCLRMQK
ncbi:Agrin-like protein, partial [Dinothrombium tinctorium]